MARYAYVNGRYVPHADARIHVEDRGYQFADGVYEIVTVHQGRLIDEEPHLDRLEHSLGELRIAWPMSRRALGFVLRELVGRNAVSNGIVYLQITRGVAPRDHRFPPNARPSLVITTRRMKMLPPATLENGVAVVTLPDIRWRRCDIKSISLLPNVLGKQQAVEAGAYEAWLVDAEGFITEGTSTNAWIVTASGKLVTRHRGQAILSGVTRRSLLQLLASSQIELEERRFTVAEARLASEAFLTSSTSFVLPVTRIDNVPIANGRPGPLSRRLREIYMDYMKSCPATP